MDEGRIPANQIYKEMYYMENVYFLLYPNTKFLRNCSLRITAVEFSQMDSSHQSCKCS